MHGLSTLNRLLGKKNKEVSRSTSNLSKSHTNLDSSSQHKKISPIFNNPPFEQSFRVTVYLPKNQLYVERIGAKTKLEKLMNDVCDSKSLSADKYEFRHPVDISQVFDNDKTIGEVGLNELRLVLKTESRFNGDFHRFHADDMLKYRSSNVPESVSSSEISRNLKNVSKTSPYSSTNSLNSLDSTGMNSTGKTTQQQQPPVAPIRKKKRMAPRPPSENSIPEQEIFSSTTLNVFKEPHSILPRKNFHVSSPQLYNNTINNSSSNNNIEFTKKSDSNNNHHTELRSISSRLNAITRPSSLYASSATSEIAESPPERQRNNSESSEIQSILKDSVDSKHSSLERIKKKSPAPVPPSRSRSASKPTPSPRTVQEDMKQQQSITEIKEVEEHENVGAAIAVTTTTAAAAAAASQLIEEIQKDNNYSIKSDDINGNISKVLLNNNTKHNGNICGSNDGGPSSIETADGISIQIISTEATSNTKTTTVTSASNLVVVAQQQTREIESAKLPVASKVHISHPDGGGAGAADDDETRSTEGEEEEEMAVNIYNVTKSCVVTCEKPAEKHVTVENNNVVKEETTAAIQEQRQRSPSPEWTYKLPAPPVLNDAVPTNNTSSPTDRHKSSVDGANGKFYADYSSTADNETILSDSNTTTVSAETHIQPVINERKQALDDSFVVNSITPVKADSVVDSDKSATEVITSDLEDGYLGNSKSKSIGANVIEVNVMESSSFTSASIETNRGMEREIVVDDFQRSRLIITRSDSFHSIGQQKKSDFELKRTNLNALPQRSTSFLSLNHSHKTELSSSKMNAENVPYSRQKSTSELSISDVPSLQSLEVLRNILNSSRKNSLQDAISGSALVKESEELNAIAKVKETADIKQTPVPVMSTTDEVKSIEKAYVDELKERYSKKLDTQKSEPAPVTTVVAAAVERVNKKPEMNNSQWRYSGPPKINFSTWNERPKVEVSVMSDEDYIFGGVSSLQRDSVTRSRQMFEQKSETTTLVGVTREKSYESGGAVKSKEAEKHLPKVLHVEYKKEIIPVELRKTSNVSSSSLSSSEIMNNNTKTHTTTTINIKPRPASMDYSSAPKATNTTTTTIINSNNYPLPSSTQFVSYNRLTGNHKKFTPIVHGFAKLDNISETQADVKSLPIANKIASDARNEKQRAEAPIIPLKPAYLRSTSAGDINRNAKLTPLVTTESNDAYDDSPFSQTLRRTGLIEKRLNDDKKTVSMFGRVIETPNAINQNNSNRVPIVEEKVTFRQHSLPAAPPLPPPPMPAASITTSAAATLSFRKSAPAGEMQMDARHELLDAIKNFNKDSLRRK